VRAEHHRRAQQVQRQLGVRRGLLLQQLLELGLLLRVEQPLGRAGGPVLLHPHRVVAVEAVGRDRRRVDEAARPGVGGRAERVERALDVDRPRGLAVAADDEEGQVHHDVGAAEGLTQRVDVADVAAAVLHLRPAVLVRVERPPGDADDAPDAVVALQQRHEAEAEGAGRAGDGDGQAGIW
jgi:hypothetical protein